MSVNENWKKESCCEKKDKKKKCKCKKRPCNNIKFRIGAENGGILLDICLTPFMAISVFLGIACVILAGKTGKCGCKCCK